MLGSGSLNLFHFLIEDSPFVLLAGNLLLWLFYYLGWLLLRWPRVLRWKLPNQQTHFTTEIPFEHRAIGVAEFTRVIVVFIIGYCPTPRQPVPNQAVVIEPTRIDKVHRIVLRIAVPIEALRISQVVTPIVIPESQYSHLQPAHCVQTPGER